MKAIYRGIVATLCGIVAAFAIYYLAMIAENTREIAENCATLAENAQAIADNCKDVAENLPRYTECGACGAETLDVWYVPNMYTGEFVPVCQECYRIATEE